MPASFKIKKALAQRQTESGILVLNTGKGEKEGSVVEQEECLDLVAFRKVETICHEYGEFVDVDVVRRGQLESTVSVQWRTVNYNMIPESFVELEGTLLLGPQQNKASIRIPILQNDVWNMEALQYIQLHSPDNCVLGELRTTTVVILDEDAFPSGIDHGPGDAYRLTPEQITAAKKESRMRVVWLFLMHMAHYFPSEFRWGILYKLYPSVSWLVIKLIMLFSINTIIPNKDKPQIYIAAVVFAADLVISSVVAERFNCLRLGGKCRALMRMSILSVNLQLETTQQHKYDSGDVLNMMSDGVDTMVSMVWANFFNLVQNIAILLTMVGLMLYTMRNSLWLCVFPFAMLIFDAVLFILRAPGQATLYQSYLEQEASWKTIVVETTDLRSCVTAYRAGAKVVKNFGDTHGQCNATNFEQQTYFRKTKLCVQWFHTLLASFLLVFAAIMVMHDDMKIGGFAVLMGTVFQFGGQVISIFVGFNEMANGYSVIDTIAEFLNAPTRRRSLLLGQTRRHQHLGRFKDKEAEFKEDMITFGALEYYYSEQQWSEEEAKMVDLPKRALGPISLMVAQGQLIAIISEHRGGKKTLLQLLGRVLLPTQGFLWYPENLRVRYLHERPMLFNDTVLANLQFGMQKDIPEEVVWETCESLGIGHLKPAGGKPKKIGAHGHTLSASDQSLLCVARALLSSVDLLLLPNTLDLLVPSSRKRVMGVLRDMVENKGLPFEVRQSDFTTRKAKTVVFITHNQDLEDMASVVLALGAPVQPEDESLVGEIGVPMQSKDDEIALEMHPTAIQELDDALSL